MKKYILLTLFILTASVSEAQTFAELFKQKKTQKKYLLQQIAALHIYTQYIEKGYAIVSGGLHIIGAVKNGELNLHTAFFHSLKNVNPKIEHYTKVTDIMLLQTNIAGDCKRTFRWLSHNDNFNKQELAYIHRVFERLLDDGLATMDALMMVVTPGRLEMKDNERLERINRLYNDMQQQYIFSKKFTHEVQWIAAYREKERNSIRTSYDLHELKKLEP